MTSDIDFESIDEETLKLIEADPSNFESFQIEYKVKYDGNADELRRDVVAFANGDAEGYIFFGIADNPITIRGIEKNHVDGLKRVLNEVLPQKIDPILDPFPSIRPIQLLNGECRENLTCRR